MGLLPLGWRVDGDDELGAASATARGSGGGGGDMRSGSGRDPAELGRVGKPVKDNAFSA